MSEEISSMLDREHMILYDVDAGFYFFSHFVTTFSHIFSQLASANWKKMDKFTFSLSTIITSRF